MDDATASLTVPTNHTAEGMGLLADGGPQLPAPKDGGVGPQSASSASSPSARKLIRFQLPHRASKPNSSMATTFMGASPIGTPETVQVLGRVMT